MASETGKSAELLADKVLGLMETIYKTSQANQTKTEELIKSNEKISNSQNKLIRITGSFTAIIAIATLINVFISFYSVKAIENYSVEIQKSILQSDMETNQKNIRISKELSKARKTILQNQKKYSDIKEAYIELAQSHINILEIFKNKPSLKNEFGNAYNDLSEQQFAEAGRTKMVELKNKIEQLNKK
jgi:hypothetical protein